jgi:hypothetical protein
MYGKKETWKVHQLIMHGIVTVDSAISSERWLWIPPDQLSQDGMHVGELLVLPEPQMENDWQKIRPL